MRLNIKGNWFQDKEGRNVLLRGVNLGGSTKVPVHPNGATHIKTDFRDHKNVSFVGRPFPLEEAEEHFTRIKHWGFNCLRFLIIWEAIEHYGPGNYDKDYLEYLEEVLKIADEHDFYIFIDPHQDSWSRMTGGDGAPGWLFEKVGLDFTKFDASEAAFVMQYRYDPEDPKAYPAMYWDNNNVRLASATMWTLFFGGKDFAPSCKIEGKNVQEYMQMHYFNSVREVAVRVKDFPSVIGFDTLNEPKQGWIEQYVDGGEKEGFSEILGHDFAPIDAMAIAAGIPREVGYREIKGVGIKETRRDMLNIDKVSCWFEDAEDIWRREGVWTINEKDEPIILRNDHFVNVKGKRIDFYADYMSPFINDYAKMVHEIIPDAILFFEGPEMRMIKGEQMNYNLLAQNGPFVHAPHWYDAAASATKKAWIRMNLDIMNDKLVFGKKNVQKMFNRQLNIIKTVSERITGGNPTLIGEFGLHVDLNHKKAYKQFKKLGDKAFNTNVRALSMHYNALDANLLHGTEWVYTSDNCNDWGDLWNLEDLSLFSRDQQLDPKDINSGGRATRGFCRPHFLKCAGTPLEMQFNYKKGYFSFSYEANGSIKAPTLIYVPSIQFPNGYEIKLSEETIQVKEKDQILEIISNGSKVIKIELARKR